MEMETAVVQERGHESSQTGNAPGSGTGEPQTACDSAGSETPVQPDGGLWAWIVCLTAMLNYGTVSGLINSLSLVYVIMLKEFSHGDVSLAFKICKFSACTICAIWLHARARAHARTHARTRAHTHTHTHTEYQKPIRLWIDASKTNPQRYTALRHTVSSIQCTCTESNSKYVLLSLLL